MLRNSVTFYTIGHGDRMLDELLELLQLAGIQCLVDIRSYPRSRRHPQFNDAPLRAALDDAGLIYHWAGHPLGGVRRGRPDSPHRALADDGLRAFADHMDSDEFQRGAAQLTRLAQKSRCAAMCAEGAPERCHRSLLADYLTLHALRVVHLLSDGETREHLLSPLARRESSRLIYDRGSRPVSGLDS